MSTFLFVALIAFAAFELLAYLRNTFPVHQRLNHHWWPAAAALALLLAGTVGVVLYALYRHFHPPYGTTFFVNDIVFGSVFAASILGLVFGIGAGIFLNNLLASPTKRALSLRAKIGLGALLAVFLAGTVAPHLARDLRQLKFAFGGAEISFSQIASSGKEATGRGSGLSYGPSFAASSAEVAPTLFALNLITELPDLIARDQFYVGIVAQKHRGASAVRTGRLEAIPGATFPMTPADDALLRTASKTVDHADQASQAASLQPAKEFADLMVRPVGRCLSSSYALPRTPGLSSKFLTTSRNRWPISDPLATTIRMASARPWRSSMFARATSF